MWLLNLYDPETHECCGEYATFADYDLAIAYGQKQNERIRTEGYYWKVERPVYQSVPCEDEVRIVEG